MDIKQVEQIKEQGNSLFKQKDLKSAAIAFQNGVDLIEKSGQNVSDNKDLKTLYLQLSTNLALCHLNQNQHFEAIQICNKVLKIDPDNTKALYRRALSNKAQAESQLYSDPKDLESLRIKDGLFSQARADLEKLNTLEENKAVKQELSYIVKESVKIKIALKNLDPNYQNEKKKLEVEEVNQNQDKESDIQEVVINKSKKNNENLKISQNFTIQQLNEVTKNAFDKMAEQILSRKENPQNTFQYEQEFETFKKHSDKLYLYIKKLPTDIYKKIFSKKDYPPTYLLLILDAINKHSQQVDYPLLVEVFQNIKDTYKFNMCLMQITKDEKKSISNLFKTIGAPEDLFKSYKLV
ncbi:hypothetical protein ABPG74_001121 [Tetrahymena malaccensis]